ncbi:hypothetical protein REH65_33110 (plasmid) [Saccharopolyspora sp. ID03-671]|uniref:hypothetical protein n=1 Tax=Saccharopolyspora sp. ID03-671 TaxID=3073066 RepID=UPI0030F38A21
MTLPNIQPYPDPTPCRYRSWWRGLRRWFIALRARTGTYIPEHVDGAELRRVEDYANGSRRFMLYTTVGVDDWQARRDQVENALSQALIAAGLATTPARSLRLHGGSNGRGRLQCWGIPAPHGPEVLADLAGLLAISELGLGRDIHVCSD